MSYNITRYTKEEFVNKITTDDYQNLSFLVYNHDSTTQPDIISLIVNKIDPLMVSFDYTEDTIVDAVYSIISQNHMVNDSFLIEGDLKKNQVVELSAANKVAVNTRRGAGNAIINDEYITYIGDGSYNILDMGIVVFKDGESYAIVTIDDVANSSISSLENYFVKITN